MRWLYPLMRTRVGTRWFLVLTDGRKEYIVNLSRSQAAALAAPTDSRIKLVAPNDVPAGVRRVLVERGVVPVSWRK